MAQQGTNSGGGQQKTHTMTNAAGETREVTQEDWRLNGKQYRAEGWTRPDEDETVEGEAEPTA